MQNKLQYTFGGKFSVFGYSYPKTDINQSEIANESRYFIMNADMHARRFEVYPGSYL